jgi:dihydroflavonol-4-reductase
VEIVWGNLNDENLFKLMVGCEVLFHVAAALFSLAKG